MLALAIIALTVRVVKGGIHVICYVIVASYVSFNALNGAQSLSDSAFYVYDMLRIALLMTVIMVFHERSNGKGYYKFYSLVLFTQMLFSLFMFVGVYNTIIFDAVYAAITIIELGVFFDGIYRSIIADNGKKPRDFPSGSIDSCLYKLGNRASSCISNVQKGVKKI